MMELNCSGVRFLRDSSDLHTHTFTSPHNTFIYLITKLYAMVTVDMMLVSGSRSVMGDADVLMTL